MNILRIIFILVLLNSSIAEASYTWSPRCKNAYSAVFALNFNKASQLISEEKAANPSNLVPLFIENQLDFFKTFISEEPTALEVLKKNTELRIALLEKSAENPNKRLFIGEMQLQLALGRLKFEEFFTAANDIRKANKNLSENQQKYPAFAANLRGLGLIHTVIGTIPKNYQWVTNMLGITGSIPQGMGELKKLLGETNTNKDLEYLHDETVLLLTFLELGLDKKNENTEQIRKRFYTIDNIEGKPLIQFAKSVFHFAIAENDSVIALLSSRKYELGSFPIYYLDYMEGSARLHAMDFTADKYFERYTRNYKGKSYMSAAWQRRAWIRLLQNDTVGYNTMMAKCKISQKESDLTDEDKQAAKDATLKQPPNLILLKSRLYFDGGYYLKALNQIAGKNVSEFPLPQDKLELTYRLARIFDKIEKKDKAIYYYNETYKNGAASTAYYAANSALMIALIYEDANDKKQAIAYYKKVLALPNHDFQNSIDQKAKAGLNRLE